MGHFLLDVGLCGLQLNLYARLNKPNEASEAYTDAVQKLGNIVKAYG